MCRYVSVCVYMCMPLLIKKKKKGNSVKVEFDLFKSLEFALRKQNTNKGDEQG